MKDVCKRKYRMSFGKYYNQLSVEAFKIFSQKVIFIFAKISYAQITRMYVIRSKKMHQILGENILKLRKENGLTQEKLASMLGVSFQAVSRWENGVSQS